MYIYIFICICMCVSRYVDIVVNFRDYIKKKFRNSTWVEKVAKYNTDRQNNLPGD